MRQLALACALVAIVGCAQGPSQAENPGAVVDRFLAARETRNLDATMDCFADQPEMRSSLGVSRGVNWTGRDVVRAIMSYRLLDTYTVGDRQVVGDRVIWSEHVRRGVAGSLSTTFDEDMEAVVVGGRIRSLMVYVGGAHPNVSSDTTTPTDPVGTSLIIPISILLLVTGAVLIWPPSPRLPAPRPANGQLLSGLREYVDRKR